MAPSYVTHPEQYSGAAPGRGALLALAAVLRTSVSALTGGDADPRLVPDGPGRRPSSPS
ncbi:hypothetical protein [Streptomyces sp. ATMOS53]|jgi:hypothetical protein